MIIKKYILTIVVLICFVNILKSQDTIMMRNGDEIQAKVVEITANELKYKLFNNQDGPTIVVSKNDVFMIKYQNHTKEVFKKQKETSNGIYKYYPYNNYYVRHNKDSIRKEKRALYNKDKSRLLIGYDIAKGIIDENSLTLGYKLTSHQFITTSIGFTYYNEFMLNQGMDELSPDQESDPFFAYMGPTFRVSYNYLFSYPFYIGLDVFYKHLYYSYHNFYETLETNGLYSTFQRSEDATVYGMHIDLGCIIIYPNSKLYLNPFLGIGMTTKNRTYTTFDEDPPYYVDPWVPLGTFKQKLNYISFMVGFNIGIKI